MCRRYPRASVPLIFNRVNGDRHAKNIRETFGKSEFGNYIILYKRRRRRISSRGAHFYSRGQNSAVRVTRGAHARARAPIYSYEILGGGVRRLADERSGLCTKGICTRPRGTRGGDALFMRRIWPGPLNFFATATTTTTTTTI